MDEFASMLERATEPAPDGLEARVSTAIGRANAADRRATRPDRSRRGRRLLLVAAVLVVVVAAGAIAFAVRADGGLELTTNGRRVHAPATTTIPEPSTGVVARFCVVAKQLSGERPESYVGSPAHVRDITHLTAVAPITIHGSAERYRRFLAGGGVDPADPDSNLQSHWPSSVRAAVQDLARYIAAACPGSNRPLPAAPHEHPDQAVLASGRSHGTAWWLLAWPSEDDLPVRGRPVHRTGYCIGVTSPPGGDGVCTYAYGDHHMTTTYAFGHAGRQDVLEGSATANVTEIRVVLKTGAVRAATPRPIPGTTLRGWVVPLPTEGVTPGDADGLRPLQAVSQIVAVRPGVDQVLLP
ncbi:MAG: hypothetical protein JO291_06175 [Acidimicrobiia bacterium]|nr:hypothetical protein [Acidimicrobiia bacterium]